MQINLSAKKDTCFLNTVYYFIIKEFGNIVGGAVKVATGYIFSIALFFLHCYVTNNERRSVIQNVSSQYKLKQLN